MRLERKYGMRCHNCGNRIRKGARFCAQCGAERSTRAKSASNKSVNRIFTALICCALFVAAVCFLNAWLESKRADQVAISASKTPEPSPTPEPAPTEPVKLTLPPLPTPTPAPSRKPIGQQTGEPTAVPTPTPAATFTPVPTEAIPVWEEDLEPIDALIEFLLNGEPAYVRKAFPPEYITQKVQSHSYAATVMGGEDGVIRMIGRMIVSGLNMQYGTISSITYDIESRRELTPSELEHIIRGLPAYGITQTPDSGRQLVLRMKITSSKGTQFIMLEPRVLHFGSEWFMHPEDIDELA